MEARIERVASPGDADAPESNAWIVGDDDEVIVVNPGRDADAVLSAIGDREILAVICTHGHAAHVAAAPRWRRVTRRRSRCIPGTGCCGGRRTPDGDPEIDMEDGGIFEVADVSLEVIHAPGHSPGSVCLYSEELEAVFAGDSVTAGGPVPHDGEYHRLPRAAQRHRRAPADPARADPGAARARRGDHRVRDPEAVRLVGERGPAAACPRTRTDLMRREEQLGLDGMPTRLYACTPTRLSTWLGCRRQYRMSYLDRPTPRKGPPWAHNSLGASVHNALAGWWRLPQAQRTVPAAGGLLERGWINEGFASDAQSAAVRNRARGMVEDYVSALDPADEPAGVERTVGARTDRITFSGRIDRLDERRDAGGGRELVVVDYKTGRRPLSTDDARSSLPLALYAVAAARVLRRPCHRVELHHLPTRTVHAWEHTPRRAGAARGPGRGHRRRVRGRRPALP